MNKTYGLTLTTTFTDLLPKIIRIRTTPGHEEDERFFMFDMNITNNLPAGGDWGGFAITTIDLIDPLPHTFGQVHPKWAHIHPQHTAPNAGSTTPKGPDYKQFPVLDQETDKGVESLKLSGGKVTVGNIWAPQRIRIHDKNARGDEFVSSDLISFDIFGPMEFQLTLQPYAVPEPGTLALLGTGFGMLAVRLRRRYHRSRDKE